MITTQSGACSQKFGFPGSWHHAVSPSVVRKYLFARPAGSTRRYARSLWQAGPLRVRGEQRAGGAECLETTASEGQLVGGQLVGGRRPDVVNLGFLFFIQDRTCDP